MHILHVNQFYWPHDRGGSGMSTRELAEMQAADGHRLSVLAQTPGQRDERLEHHGVEIHQLALASTEQRRRPMQDRLLQRAWGQIFPEVHPGLPAKLKQLLLQLKPDLIHTHVIAGVSSRIWPLARELDIPVVHTLHDYYLLCARGIQVRNGSRCAKPCRDCELITYRRRQQANLVDAVVGVSRFVLQRHRDQGCFPNVAIQRVIANGVDVTPLQQAPVDNGTLRIAYLGRLHPSKAPEVLIDAVRLCHDLNLRVTFGGDGDAGYRESLAQRAAGLPVSFAGEVSADEFLAAHDVLVVTSQFEEPFGRILIEGWAQGLPVLCARRGGAQELIDEGRTGWLFEPDQPSELAALLKLASTAITDDQRAACRRRSADFSPARCRESYQEIYAETLQRTDRSVRASQLA